MARIKWTLTVYELYSFNIEMWVLYKRTHTHSWFFALFFVRTAHFRWPSQPLASQFPQKITYRFISVLFFFTAYKCVCTRSCIIRPKRAIALRVSICLRLGRERKTHGSVFETWTNALTLRSLTHTHTRPYNRSVFRSTLPHSCRFRAACTCMYISFDGILCAVSCVFIPLLLALKPKSHPYKRNGVACTILQLRSELRFFIMLSHSNRCGTTHATISF